MSGHIDLFLLGCGFDKLKWTCLLEVWASRRAFTFLLSVAILSLVKDTLEIVILLYK